MENRKIRWILIVGVLLFLVGCSSGQKETSKDESDQTSTVAKNEKKQEPVTIYLTRHGKTLFNTMERTQGWSDTPLTKEGIEVAEKLGQGLKENDVTFVAAYASDLTRAKETAGYILESSGQSEIYLNESKNLREACYGKFEGGINDEMLQAFSEHLGYASYDDFAKAAGNKSWELSADAVKELDIYEMAEDAQTIKTRMQEQLKKIAIDVEAKGGGNVLVVSHGMSINIMLSDMTPAYTGKPLKNASITKIVYEDGEFTVESIGDTSLID
ncbi:histidine phosphatase family protein [Isobaculum melis]|uniref:Probable phosphoglycerate mutase n=1 Tax=Isobaculum melis TaxID=142588 RepID=A0A1H9RLW8_9LACT|nr:histidine phosphatase family protein [Isobaculum melis]SER73684.1 probable phosphoglycerate mutase [Isobaculum melis]